MRMGRCCRPRAGFCQAICSLYLPAPAGAVHGRRAGQAPSHRVLASPSELRKLRALLRAVLQEGRRSQYPRGSAFLLATRIRAPSLPGGPVSRVWPLDVRLEGEGWGGAVAVCTPRAPGVGMGGVMKVCAARKAQGKLAPRCCSGQASRSSTVDSSASLPDLQVCPVEVKALGCHSCSWGSEVG